ncbi:MAG: adenylate kinase [Erysipelotrichaceae bacterium]|nr:adenylate kinase [Erysipelotrichaceae bacterium]
MNILIMGPAGSGKGTMSELIIKAYGVTHISTGDMLRENVKNQTALGMEAKGYMDAGRLVPDDLINAMVKERIQQPDCQKGYLMDGFPRTLAQAEAFEEMTKAVNKPVEVVIDLQVGFDTLAERITGRRVCKTCGSIFHTKNKPPKVEGICDNCGAPLVQRSDDTIEQLKVRLDEHDKNTKPVLDFYAKKGIVKTVDAALPAEEVWKKVEAALG